MSWRERGEIRRRRSREISLTVHRLERCCAEIASEGERTRGSAQRATDDPKLECPIDPGCCRKTAPLPTRKILRQNRLAKHVIVDGGDQLC
jgi:hypothetical protein